MPRAGLLRADTQGAVNQDEYVAPLRAGCEGLTLTLSNRTAASASPTKDQTKEELLTGTAPQPAYSCFKAHVPAPAPCPETPGKSTSVTQASSGPHRHPSAHPPAQNTSSSEGFSTQNPFSQHHTKKGTQSQGYSAARSTSKFHLLHREFRME